MNVLMLTYNDWANTGYRFSRCLKHLGLNVTYFKGNLHKFNYPEQAAIHQAIAEKKPLAWFPVVVRVPELQYLAKKADIIHFIASTLIDTGVDLRTKKVVVQHGGTTYRLESEAVNKLFNQFADAAIIQFPTLLGYGAKNEHLVYYPVDTDYIKPKDFNTCGKGKLIIGHFPSDWTAKGTKIIIDVLEKLKKTEYGKRFEYVGLQGLHNEQIYWYENIERMRKCDVIIETIQPELRGKPFGEWGNTALEAAALGKLVITNSIRQDIYKKEYNNIPPLFIANDKEMLEQRIKEICDMPDAEIKERKMLHRDWAERYHSIPATSGRLWETVYKNLINGAY